MKVRVKESCPSNVRGQVGKVMAKRALMPGCCMINFGFPFGRIQINWSWLELVV